MKTGIIPKTAFIKGVHFSKGTEFKKGNTPWHIGKKNAIPIWNKGIKFDQVRGDKHWNLRFDISNGQTLCLGCHKKTGTYKGKKYAAEKRA